MKSIKWFWLGLFSSILLALWPGSSHGLSQHVIVPNALKPYGHRLGLITVVVKNPQGQPIPNAKVELQQTKQQFPFGVALASHLFQDQLTTPSEQAQYKTIAKTLFNAAVHENALKWADTEPKRGQVSYELADKILAWSQQNGLKMRGHTLFWEVAEFQPDWLKTLSPDQLRAVVKKRAIQVCQRYRGQIDEFDLNNEMLHGDFFRSRLGPGIVQEMAAWCRAGNPDAVLYVNDYGIIDGDKLLAYVGQIQELLDQGVPLGGIGIQAHLVGPLNIPYMVQVLDTLAKFGLPLKITEVSVNVADEAQQAQILADIYKTAFAHPAVAGIYLWGFWQGAHWRPNAALYRQDFSPKLAAQRLKELLQGAWWTHASGRSNSQGIFEASGWRGTYTLTVITPNSQVQQTFELTDATVTIPIWACP